MTYFIYTVLVSAISHLGLLQLRHYGNWRCRSKVTLTDKDFVRTPLFMKRVMPFQWIEQLGWWYYDQTVGRFKGLLFWLTAPHLAYNEHLGMVYVCLYRDYKRNKDQYQRYGRFYDLSSNPRTSWTTKVLTGLSYVSTSKQAGIEDRITFIGTHSLHLRGDKYVVRYTPDLYVPYSVRWSVESDAKQFPALNHDHVTAYLTSGGRKFEEEMKQAA